MKAEERPSLREPLSARMWKLQKLEILKKCRFRCVICREQFGASRLIIKHLAFPGVSRSNEIQGWKVFCTSCLQ